MSLNESNKVYSWADDFEEMDFSADVEFPDLNPLKAVDKKTDNYVVKISKFPVEFVPESAAKRLRIFKILSDRD
jgi:hypothetical protein